LIENIAMMDALFEVVAIGQLLGWAERGIPISGTNRSADGRVIWLL